MNVMPIGLTYAVLPRKELLFVFCIFCMASKHYTVMKFVKNIAVSITYCLVDLSILSGSYLSLVHSIDLNLNQVSPGGFKHRSRKWEIYP